MILWIIITLENEIYYNMGKVIYYTNSDAALFEFIVLNYCTLYICVFTACPVQRLASHHAFCFYKWWISFLISLCNILHRWTLTSGAVTVLWGYIHIIVHHTEAWATKSAKHCFSLLWNTPLRPLEHFWWRLNRIVVMSTVLTLWT